MPYIISEQRYKKLLIESVESTAKTHIGRGKDIVKQHIKDVSTQQKLNFRFLLTYGAGISTFISPVERYLSGEYPNLNSGDVSLLVLSAISILFFESKDYIQALKEINQRGLSEELNSAVVYTENLKDKIVDILNILGLSTYRMLDVLSYSFILPLLSFIKTQINNGLDISLEDIFRMVESVSAAFGVTLVGTGLKKGLEKLSKKFFDKLS